MASEKFNLSNNVKQVATGISGVSALKSGNKVQLWLWLSNSLTYTGPGWQTLGILPASIRPHSTFRFVAFDNQAPTYSNSPAIPMQVNSSGGLQVYVFSDKLSFQPMGGVEYFADNTD